MNIFNKESGKESNTIQLSESEIKTLEKSVALNGFTVVDCTDTWVDEGSYLSREFIIQDNVTRKFYSHYQTTDRKEGWDELGYLSDDHLVEVEPVEHLAIHYIAV